MDFKDQRVVIDFTYTAYHGEVSTLLFMKNKIDNTVGTYI